MVEASIKRYNFTSGTQVFTSQGGEHVGRIIIRVTADTRMALDEGQLDYDYIVFPSGTIIVLDPPNLFNNDTLWFRLDSAASGVLEVVRC